MAYLGILFTASKDVKLKKKHGSQKTRFLNTCLKFGFFVAKIGVG